VVRARRLRGDDERGGEHEQQRHAEGVEEKGEARESPADQDEKLKDRGQSRDRDTHESPAAGDPQGGVEGERDGKRHGGRQVLFQIVAEIAAEDGRGAEAGEEHRRLLGQRRLPAQVELPAGGEDTDHRRGGQPARQEPQAETPARRDAERRQGDGQREQPEDGRPLRQGPRHLDLGRRDVLEPVVRRRQDLARREQDRPAHRESRHVDEIEAARCQVEQAS